MTFAKPHGHEKFEHKGQAFLLDKTAPGHWQIADATGTDYGSIEMISRHGSDDDPVYNGFLAGHDSYTHFGSDWRGIVGTLINDYQGEHRFA